jgi:hypothetical protein
MTKEHKNLLYLISKYSRSSQVENEEEIWMKELPLRVFIYEGITQGIFDYDYSPLSVEMIGGRRFLNISQESEDDIADLRELGLIENLKLSAVTYLLINAFKIKKSGLKVLNSTNGLSSEERNLIDKLCECPSCNEGLLETKINPHAESDTDIIIIFCRNPECNYEKYSEITKFEDVCYKTSPYIPNIQFYSFLDLDKKDGTL